MGVVWNNTAYRDYYRDYGHQCDMHAQYVKCQMRTIVINMIKLLNMISLLTVK